MKERVNQLRDWHDNEDGVAGALICLGAMLYEWGLPLDKAIKGIRRAYELEAVKEIKGCKCRNDRDRELCQDKDACAEIFAFAKALGVERTAA